MSRTAQMGIAARIMVFLGDNEQTEIIRAESQMHIAVTTQKDGKRIGIQMPMHIMLDPRIRAKIRAWERRDQCTLSPFTTKVHYDQMTLTPRELYVNGSIIDRFVIRLQRHFTGNAFQWQPTTRREDWYREITMKAEAAAYGMPLQDLPIWMRGAVGYAQRRADVLPVIDILRCPPGDFGDGE